VLYQKLWNVCLTWWLLICARDVVCHRKLHLIHQTLMSLLLFLWFRYYTDFEAKILGYQFLLVLVILFKPFATGLHKFVTLHICLFLWSMKWVFTLPSISTDLLHFRLKPCTWKFWKFCQAWILRHAWVPLAWGLRVFNVATQWIGEGTIGGLISNLRLGKFSLSCYSVQFLNMHNMVHWLTF